MTSSVVDILADISYSEEDNSLEEWLGALEMPELRTMFELHGWDNVAFIRGVMTLDDLVVMGMSNAKVKKKLLTAVEADLVSFQHGSLPGTVEEWLVSIDLAKYLNKFISCRMGSIGRVLEIWDIELTSILNIQPLGHRRRIMRSIKDLKRLHESIEEAAKSKKCSTPSHKSSWKHSTEDIVQGVDYHVRYIGSGRVQGGESTKQSSAAVSLQLKGKLKSNQKLPEFRLRISSNGIQLIDKTSQKSTSSYLIQDISFVSRDKGDLLLFSFISSDRQHDIKMCHVFKASTRNQAYDACTTIAQSFEVAFQLQQQTKSI